MAKKITKAVIKTEESPLLTKADILQIAKNQGYKGLDSIYEVQAWIRVKYTLHAELFYSMFHKKFSINNYFIDLSNGKKLDWDYKSTMYNSYDEALIIALYNLLIAIK
jgi:hypothetical protein